MIAEDLKSLKNENNMTENKSRPLTILLIGLLFGGCLAQAQESVNVSGGNASGSEGTVAYTIGQVFYTSTMDGLGGVTQGVQHTYEICNVVITQESTLNIPLAAFPNPTTENLTLQISDYINKKLSYHLFDLQGKLLSNGKIVEPLTKINMNGLPTATYFIYLVNQDNKKIESFKIIKTQ